MNKILVSLSLISFSLIAFSSHAFSEKYNSSSNIEEMKFLLLQETVENASVSTKSYFYAFYMNDYSKKFSGAGIVQLDTGDQDNSVSGVYEANDDFTELRIEWYSDELEEAKLSFGKDQKKMEYKIVSHTDRSQVGSIYDSKFVPPENLPEWIVDFFNY